MSELSRWALQEKRVFLDEQEAKGGTRKTFREYVREKYKADPMFFVKMSLDGVVAAAEQAWERQPRKSGDDLFSVNGYTIPETLTRPAPGRFGDTVDLEEDPEGEAFEKVAQQYAIGRDMGADLDIKLRKAAQASAAAAEEAKAFDEIRRRAKGDLEMPLKDVVDKPIGKKRPRAA